MGFFRKKKTADPVKVIRQQRAFAAAQLNTLLSNWSTVKNQIDQDIKTGGAALRVRARDAATNNDYGRKYLAILKTNVVGSQGIRLQCRATNQRNKLDKTANDLTEAAWKRFSKAVDVTGKLTLIDAQNLFIESAARDGEVFVRLVQNFPNAFGFALQFIDPDSIDEQHNDQLNNGREIKMGVELDGWGKPHAYWVTVKSPGENTYIYNGQHRKRIPASQMLHAYRQERAVQTRGFSWMAAALVEMHHLQHFNEAAVIAARIGASSMGFFTKKSPDSGLPEGETGADGSLIMDAEPGQFRELPWDLDFKSFDSKYPSDMVDAFVSRSLKSIASGLNVSYNSLASDPQGTSYGTLRSFSIEERDYFRTLQNWLAEAFLQPLYQQWLDLALMKKQIGQLGAQENSFEKLSSIRWQPRGWQWIDPAKDAAAFTSLLENNLTAPSLIAAEQGRDFEEVCQQIAADRQILQQYGLLASVMETSDET